MLRLFQWLRQHPIWNIVILIVYYCLVVLPHELVGVTIAGIFEGKTRAYYNGVILALAGVIAVVVLIPFLIRIIKHPRRGIGLMYLLSLIGLITLTFNTIIVVNIELIHIIQYGVFAILAFPLMGGYTVTLLFTSLLGAMDEAYQYFYLSPQRTDYYDLNDVIFNTLGGACGLLWLWSHQTKTTYRTLKSIVLSWQSLITVGLLLILTILIGLGYLAYFPTEGIDSLWTLVREVPEGFWKTIDAGTITFHVTLPIEGLLYCIILWVVYGTMDKTAFVNSEPYSIPK
jgi:hypothetical protein